MSSRKKVEVSKPGTNPFKQSGRMSLMQSVLKALSTIVTSHDREPTVAHRLVLVARLADAVLGIILKSPEEAERAKIAVSPLAMAVQMAKLVIRRTKGLRITRDLQDDACRLVRNVAKAGVTALKSEMKKEKSPKSWPELNIDQATTRLRASVRAQTRWAQPLRKAPRKTPAVTVPDGSLMTPPTSPAVSRSSGSSTASTSTPSHSSSASPPSRPSPLSLPSPSAALSPSYPSAALTPPSPSSPPARPSPLYLPSPSSLSAALTPPSPSSPPLGTFRWENVVREKGKTRDSRLMVRRRQHRRGCAPASPGAPVVPWR